jgi:hypothetical protein
MYKVGPPRLQSRVFHRPRTTRGPTRSDPNPGGSVTPFRSLLLSFVLDPTLLLTRGLDAPRLARIVAAHAGPTRDRLFTPIVTLASFLGRILSDDHPCQAALKELTQN